MNATERVLRTISDRLSYRQECNNVEYRVTIQFLGDRTYVTMFPNILVFPSIHQRKMSDKLPVLAYALRDYNILRYAVREDNSIQVELYRDWNLTNGDYVYRRYKQLGRRRWVKEGSGSNLCR